MHLFKRRKPYIPARYLIYMVICVVIIRTTCGLAIDR